MKFYIAGSDQDKCKSAAITLSKAGHEIICSWLDVPFNRTRSHTPEEREAIALLDEQEVTMADAVVLLESPERIPSGKFVEAGIAIGQGKIVFNIGRRENMLMWHPQVWQCDSVEELICKIERVNTVAKFSWRIDD